MRIGLIADIHGNGIALDTVLAALAHERIDEVICLGDVAVLGPHPRAVLQRLREIGCPTVMGNTDAWLCGLPSGEEMSAESDALNAWTLSQLSDEDRAMVRAFPQTLTRPLGNGQSLLCAHGSPRSYHDDIRATTPADHLDTMLAGVDAAFVAGGHTHMPLVRRHGAMQIINPGSVGLPGVGPAPPYNTDVHWAEYAVLDIDGDHRSITLRRTPLDVPAMITAAELSGMPYVAWWCTKWRPV